MTVWFVILVVATQFVGKTTVLWWLNGWVADLPALGWPAWAFIVFAWYVLNAGVEFSFKRARGGKQWNGSSI